MINSRIDRRAIIAAGGLVTGLFESPRLAPARRQSTSLTVSAASDLTLAFEEIGETFETQTGVTVDFNFGSTGQLTEQIAAGAPVDVFAAANVSYIERLEEQGLILSDTKAVYGRGRIVIWARADSAIPLDGLDDLTDLTGDAVQRVAIANPDHAPYGVAARDAMQTAGVWEAIQDKLILGENISDTLQYAVTGNVDVAIVALSLAITGDGRWTLIPGELHQPIDQALAVIAATTHEAEARAFATFVNGMEGRAVMDRYGFVLPGESLPAGTPAANPATGTPAATPSL